METGLDSVSVTVTDSDIVTDSVTVSDNKSCFNSTHYYYFWNVFKCTVIPGKSRY